MKKLLFIITASGIFFLFNSKVLAGDSNFDRSKIIGSYLASVDMTAKLKSSKCGYIFKKDIPSFKSRLIEVQSYLSDPELKELNTTITALEFNIKMSKNQDFIDGYLLNLKKDGIDDKTACGLLVGFITATNVKYEKDWRDLSRQSN